MSQHEFFLLTSFGRDNALRRVGSDALFDGFDALGVSSGRYIGATIDSGLLPECRYLVIHATDAAVIESARAIKRATRCEIVCLTSDLYHLDWHRELATFVDYFVAPTRFHVEILRPAVWRPVLEVPEGIDPIALPVDGLVRPVEQNDRLLWFGYPESFSKSLQFLLPRALEESRTEAAELLVLTAPGHQLLPEAEHLPFSTDNFYELAGRCGYALLSHFVFDAHINSYIKSPNKLLTALVRGSVPFASDTPSYREVMSLYQLENFTYRSGQDLVRLLAERNIERDRSSIPFRQIQEDLQSRFSPAAIGAAFINHFVGGRPRSRNVALHPSAVEDGTAVRPLPLPVINLALKRLDGAIEALDERHVHGWTRRPGSEDAVSIEIVYNGRVVGRGTTTQFRPDLSGNFGFSVVMDVPVDTAELFGNGLVVRVVAPGFATTALGPTEYLRAALLRKWADRLVKETPVDEVARLLGRLVS